MNLRDRYFNYVEENRPRGKARLARTFCGNPGKRTRDLGLNLWKWKWRGNSRIKNTELRESRQGWLTLVHQTLYVCEFHLSTLRNALLDGGQKNRGKNIVYL